MVPEDVPEFFKIMCGLAATYGRELSEASLAIYFEALSPYDLSAIRSAAMHHVRHPDQGQFFPKPADLIRVLDGGTHDRSLLAWSAVLEAIREHGAYASLDFGDPITHAVIADMGGWPQVCTTLTDDLPFREKDFRERYRVFAARGKGLEGHLVGVLEQNNDHQFPAWVPKPIGPGAGCMEPAKVLSSGHALPAGTGA